MTTATEPHIMTALRRVNGPEGIDLRRAAMLIGRIFGVQSHRPIMRVGDGHFGVRDRDPHPNGGLCSSRWVVVSADAGLFLPFHLSDQSLDVEHLVLVRCPDQSQAGDQGEETDPGKQS